MSGHLRSRVWGASVDRMEVGKGGNDRRRISENRVSSDDPRLRGTPIRVAEGRRFRGTLWTRRMHSRGDEQGQHGRRFGVRRGTSSLWSAAMHGPSNTSPGLTSSPPATAQTGKLGPVCLSGRCWSLRPACRAPALTVAAARSRTPSPRPLLRPRPIASCVDRSTLDAVPRWLAAPAVSQPRRGQRGDSAG